MFKTYKAEVENQLKKKIKVTMFDRGGEFESTTFFGFLYLTWICISNNYFIYTTTKWCGKAEK